MEEKFVLEPGDLITYIVDHKTLSLTKKDGKIISWTNNAGDKFYFANGLDAVDVSSIAEIMAFIGGSSVDYPKSGPIKLNNGKSLICFYFK